MGKPTDPDAGTNRANAVSRDNLMNEVSLGYDGSYGYYSLFNVGTNGICGPRTSIMIAIHTI